MGIVMITAKIHTILLMFLCLTTVAGDGQKSDEDVSRSFGISPFCATFQDQDGENVFYAGLELNMHWHIFSNKNYFFEYDFGIGSSIGGNHFLTRIPVGAAIGPILLIAAIQDSTMAGIALIGLLTPFIPNAIGYRIKINEKNRCNMLLDLLNLQWANTSMNFASGLGIQLERDFKPHLGVQFFANWRHVFSQNSGHSSELFQGGLTFKYKY